MISTRHLVKGEDLNHHGTLYAERGVEWMVEAGFMTASAATESENIVCMRINSLLFLKPVLKGQMVIYDSWSTASGTRSPSRFSLRLMAAIAAVSTMAQLFHGPRVRRG